MSLVFDFFRDFCSLILNTEIIFGMNLLSIFLIVLTFWSAFRFFVFPLFSKGK